MGHEDLSGMDRLEQLIDNEFSTDVIGVLNFRLDRISGLVSEHMDAEAYPLDAQISALLVEVSKEFFTQGFLRGIAVAKGHVV